MKTPVLGTMLLAALLLASPASLLRANDPPEPPEPPEPVVAPVAPAPPEAPRRHAKKKIVVDSSEKEIVVDGDRIVIRGDGDDADWTMADLDELSDGDGMPMAVLRHGHAAGGFIGVRPIEMTPELRQHFGAPKDAGILVGAIEPDGPAAKAGLLVGDIVTKVDGDRIVSTGELVRTVRHKKGGETITLELFRNRAAKSLTVTVSERKDREIRIGELPGAFPHGAWNWSSPGPRHPEAGPPPPDLPEFEQRLDELEKKLEALEKRLPTR